FRLNFLNIIHKQIPIQPQQLNFPKPTQILLPPLQTHTLVHLPKLIKPATPQQKPPPKTQKHLQQLLQHIILNQALEQFSNQLIHQLPKNL
ncbi:phage tail protein, partial [Staphylococcus epidermidis]|uniref:phage tail protein n=1 Tax=Staphylococcus epidermidis TaxID=1282 RepID=UPI001C930FB0